MHSPLHNANWRRLWALPVLSLLAASCDTGGGEPPPEPPPPPGPRLVYLWSGAHMEASHAAPRPTPEDTPGGPLLLDAGNHDLVAFRADTGEEAWRSRIDDTFVFTGWSLLADGEQAYGVHFDHDEGRTCSIRAWSLSDGTETWRRESRGCISGPNVFSDLAQNEETAFAVTGPEVEPHGVLAYAKADGRLLWRSDLNVGRNSTSLAHGDGRIYASSAYGPSDDPTTLITALDPATGTILWEFSTGRGKRYGPVQVLDGVLYQGTGTESGSLFALDAATGTELWAIDGRTESWSVTEERVYGTHPTGLYAVDRRTGEELWRMSYGIGTVSNAALEHGGYLYHFSRAGATVLNPNTGEILHQEASPDGSAFRKGASVAHGRIYAQTGAHVYAIEGFDPAEAP